MRFLFLFFFFITNCSEKNNSVNKNLSQQDSSSIKSVKETRYDTILSIQLNEKPHQLLISSGEFESALNEAWMTTTVRIVENENQDTIFLETYDFNKIESIENPADGLYLLAFSQYAGGSGWSGNLYFIKTKPEICLQLITRFSELSYWKANKKGTKLLYTEGIWGDSPDESHFDAHKLRISIIDIEKGIPKYQNLGTTTHKYQTFNNNNLFLQLEKLIQP